MNYIERVLPSLGEDVGHAALRSARSPPTWSRSAGERVDDAAVAAIKGSLRMVPAAQAAGARAAAGGAAGAAADHRGSRAGAAGRRSWPGSGPTCWATTSSTRAGRRPRRRCSTRCGGPGPPSSTWSGTSSTTRSPTRAAFAMFVNAWWPTVSATDALARLADPACFVASAGTGCPRPSEQALVGASYRDRPATGDWTVADGALLDELVHLLGPCPDAEDREVSLFLDERRRGREVVTTMERLAPVREVDPFAHAPRHVRAHPGRRGPGHHPDAVADAAPPRRRARAGPSSATRRRAPGRTPAETERAIDRADRHRAGPPVPDEHQLPQPGRGVRPGRQGGGARRTRRPTCPRPSAPPASNPSCAMADADRPGGREWPTVVRRPARAGRGHGRRDLPAVPAGADAGRGAARGRAGRRRAASSS